MILPRLSSNGICPKPSYMPGTFTPQPELLWAHLCVTSLFPDIICAVMRNRPLLSCLNVEIPQQLVLNKCSVMSFLDSFCAGPPACLRWTVRAMDFFTGFALASGKGWYRHTKQQEQDQTDGLWVACRLGPWSYRNRQGSGTSQCCCPPAAGSTRKLFAEAAAGQVAAGFPSWAQVLVLLILSVGIRWLVFLRGQVW